MYMDKYRYNIQLQKLHAPGISIGNHKNSTLNITCINVIQISGYSYVSIKCSATSLALKEITAFVVFDVILSQHFRELNVLNKK